MAAEIAAAVNVESAMVRMCVPSSCECPGRRVERPSERWFVINTTCVPQNVTGASHPRIAMAPFMSGIGRTRKPSALSAPLKYRGVLPVHVSSEPVSSASVLVDWRHGR